MKQTLARIGLAFVLLTALAAPAMAQVEVGANLFNLSVLTPKGGGDSLTVVGVPATAFAFTPGVYVAVPLGSKLAVEGNVGLVSFTQSGDSSHVAVFGGVLDWFPMGDKTSSFYVFGGGGGLNGQGESGGTVNVGAGYRIVHAERVTVRFFGRYTYVKFSNGGETGNMFDFGVTIGGIFGK